MPVIESSRRLRSIVTRKSMLPRLADKDSPEWGDSWQFLFTLYTPAMTRYVKSVMSRALKRPADNDEAQDIVQDYFSHCLEKDWLTKDVENIRCFRAYLQMQLKRFVYKHLEHKFAQKRNPGAMASAETLEGVMGDGVDPSSVELDEGWISVAVEQALAELREGNELYAEVIADLLRTEGQGSDDLGERLGQTDKQLTHLRHRARKRFSVLFHEQLRQTVLDEEAFEDLCQRLEAYLP